MIGKFLHWFQELSDAAVDSYALFLMGVYMVSVYGGTCAAAVLLFPYLFSKSVVWFALVLGIIYRFFVGFYLFANLQRPTTVEVEPVQNERQILYEETQRVVYL